MSNENLNDIVELVMKAIEKLPDPPRVRLKRELQVMKEIIMDNRPPRILILGRRGAGKSSVINALFEEKVAAVGSVLSETGRAEWHTFENSKGSIDILDTRGMGDRSKPESANFAEAIDDIKSEVKGTPPDAILFLCKAKEVDAHVNRDIDNVSTIRKFISDSHNYEIPVVALLTQVDELDPKRVEPPYDNRQKQENILKAVGALQDSFVDSHIDLLRIIPISAYAEYDNGNRTYDNYWNVDVLIDYLMTMLPNEAQLQLARLSALKKVQRKFARVLVKSTSAVCAGIAFAPISVADVIPITTAQIAMITEIAYISGRDLSKRHAMEFLVALGVNIGAGFALREGARALIKFVFPGAGNVVSAGMAYAGTWGLGEAAIAYFINEVSIEEAKRTFKQAKDEHDEDEKDEDD